MSYDFDHPPQQQGLSSGAKAAIGCGAVAFLCMTLICGGIVWFANRALDKMPAIIEQAEKAAMRAVEELNKHVDAFVARFEAEGYERVSGQVVKITSDIEKPTVYTVQVFKLEADSSASLAVMAQVAEIDGTIDGDLHFYGQVLKIHPDAVITGNVYVRASQVVDNQGTVEGNIIEDARLDLDQPAAETETLPDPEVKPSPGDVIEPSTDETTSEEPISNQEATEGDDTGAEEETADDAETNSTDN